MSSKKIIEAQNILKDLGLPSKQQNEMSALTLLALCNIKEDDNWSSASRNSLGVSKGIMKFISKNYKRKYAPNTRETVRRQVLHQFVQAGLVYYNPDNPNLPVNSPKAHYAITEETLAVVKKFGKKEWNKSISELKKRIGTLSRMYKKNRRINMVPLLLKEGTKLILSPGKHNLVQKAIIEEFAPRFAKSAKLLYLGDTERKELYILKKDLEKIGIPIDKHGKLPDVVIYNAKKKWLYLIEAVTSHGPISEKRLIELAYITKKCNASNIYVTAFPDFKEFKRHIHDLAWETEIWIADNPSHLIHFNGDKFLGPP